AAGLLAYATWRLIAAMRGSDEDGTGALAALTRLGKTLDGVFHGLLGVEAARLLARASGPTEDMAQHWSARILPLHAGKWLIVAIGAGIILYALYQIGRQFQVGARGHMESSGAGRRT